MPAMRAFAAALLHPPPELTRSPTPPPGAPHCLATRYPALYGTIAVAAGYFLHLDPLGSLHWNTHDALLGLKCAVPILLLDAALMLPDYSPGTDTKVRGGAWHMQLSLHTLGQQNQLGGVTSCAGAYAHCLLPW